jgi:serine/threonine protein kinase
VDIWGLGCIFFELIFEKKAFEGDLEVQSYSLLGRLIEMPSQTQVSKEIPEEKLLTAIRKLLHISPAQRPTAIEAQKMFNALQLNISKSSHQNTDPEKPVDSIPTTDEVTDSPTLEPGMSQY